jgi:type III secretory pathway lipoprotein EscJ
VLAGCREPILHDLAESEANRLISRLSQIDVASEKVIQADGRWSLAVGHSDTVKALEDSFDSILTRSYLE